MISKGALFLQPLFSLQFSLCSIRNKLYIYIYREVSGKGEVLMNDNKKNIKYGLTTEQAERSRNENGDNHLTKYNRNSFLKQFLSSFGDPIIKILLAALAINIVFLFQNSDWYESAGIALAVFLATFVSTLSEYGSESAFEKLREDAEKTKSRVMRNGKAVLLPVGDIVKGDIVLLQAGERVPADGIVIDGQAAVDQSPLNGESEEVTKRPGVNTGKRDLLNYNQLFSGSNVSSGECVMEVTHVGDKTFYGNIAAAMQDKTRESPLKIRLSRLAKLISRLGYIAAVIVGVADLFHSIILENNFDPAQIMAHITNFSYLGLNVLHAFTLAITIIVVAVPEGLPMMITVVLSSNMRRMLKDKVLVRKLVGIETSGSMNILFTDKTGTLTNGSLKISKIITGYEAEYDNIEQFKAYKNLYDLYMLSSIYNTQSIISNNKPLGGNGTDRALMESIFPLQRNPDCKITYKLPFDSKNKYSITRIKGEKQLTLIKGAPEKILPKCNKYFNQFGDAVNLNSKGYLNKRLKKLTANKERVIALAATDNDIKSLDNYSGGLTLIALVSIKDEIRKESRKAVKRVQKAGIQVVMITGDNKDTAMSIGKETGILNSDNKNAVLTGEELSKLTDEQLRKILPDIRIVARALATDKSRLVEAAQRNGLVAGMTGDGINDAPALKKADVGFAMGSGTEVAKEAGDIVILDDNFKSISKAVLYGRTIFHSIRKFIVFQLVMNLCAVGVSIIGPFIGIDAPVTVIQMLWVNIIMDALAGLAFAGEPPLEEYMEEKPKSLNEPILNGSMLRQILWIGCYTIILCLIFLKNHIAHDLFHYSTSENTHFMTCFFALFIFCGVFNSFNARTNKINVFHDIKKNPLFIIIMTAIIIIQILLIYMGGNLFRTVGVPFSELLIIMLISSTVIFADVIRKIIMKKRP